MGIVHLNQVGENRVVRFSLATNYVYKGRDGQGVVETTWHNITAWEGRGMPDFEKITKGKGVHVWGRVRNSKYTGQDGLEKSINEVIASNLEIEDSSYSVPQS